MRFDSFRVYSLTVTKHDPEHPTFNFAVHESKYMNTVSYGAVFSLYSQAINDNEFKHVVDSCKTCWEKFAHS